jgi:hypothetical protein
MEFIREYSYDELKKQTEANKEKLANFKKEFDALIEKYSVELCEKGDHMCSSFYVKIKDVSGDIEGLKSMPHCMMSITEYFK